MLVIPTRRCHSVNYPHCMAGHIIIEFRWLFEFFYKVVVSWSIDAIAGLESSTVACQQNSDPYSSSTCAMDMMGKTVSPPKSPNSTSENESIHFKPGVSITTENFSFISNYRTEQKKRGKPKNEIKRSNRSPPPQNANHVRPCVRVRVPPCVCAEIVRKKDNT